MRIGITEMPENGFVLQPLIGTGNVLIKLYRSPEESYDSDGNKHITANVVVLTRRNYSGIAQSIEDNFEWYWQQGEQEQMADLTKQFTDIVQKWMDDIVKKKNYDNVGSVVTYINSTDAVFKAEAVAVNEWRDKVWRHCYSVVNAVVSGERAIPSTNELLKELPALEW